MEGIIFDIKELAIGDGVGLVTTVFLKGCPLRCEWCHNPEGQNFYPELMVKKNTCIHCGSCLKKCNHPECQPFSRCIHVCPKDLIAIAGEKITALELSKRLLKNDNMLDGVTFSGGEPLAQANFLLEVIDLLPHKKITIETSGYCDPKVFTKVLEKVDYVYFDIKLFDEQQHLKYTGVSNNLILENFEILKESGKNFTIRTPLIPNITDTPGNLNNIEKLVEGYKWEKLPYNILADSKYGMLDREYPLRRKKYD